MAGGVRPACSPCPFSAGWVGRSRPQRSGSPGSFSATARGSAQRNFCCRAGFSGWTFPSTERSTTPGKQHRRDAMNWDRVEGNWKELKGKVQQKWGKLTNDDLDVIEGKRMELSGRLQQRYGVARDEAERQIDTWLKSVNLRQQPAARRGL